MKRRDFIRNAGIGAVMPSLINGLSVRALETSPILQALAASATNTDHVLVIVQMSGGNDGLNTVLPLDDNYAR